MRVGHHIGIPPAGLTPFNPGALGGGTLAAWYRADLGITLNGGNVSAWADQSGNGRHLSQGTAANQPAFSAGGGSAGQDMINFDGANDVLESGVFAVATPLQVYMVAKWDVVNATDTNVIFSGDSTVPSNSCRVSVRNVSTAVAIWGTGGGVITTGAATALAWHYWGLTWTGGASSEIKQDGVSQITGNPGATAINGITVGAFDGASTPADASVAEIIIYSSILSAADEARLNAYLKSRYGL